MAAAVATPTVLDRVFTNQQPPSPCRTPHATPYFTTGDTALYLWLRVGGMRASDEWSVVWHFPNGSSERRVLSTRFNGQGCVWVGIDLTAADRFGDWQASFQVNRVSVGGPYVMPVLGPNHPRIDEIEASGNWRLSHVSPNGWAILRGVRLASGAFPDARAELPTEAAGVRVTVNGVPARLVWATAHSVEFQVPAGARGDSIAVRAMTSRGASNLLHVPLTTASPGLFWNNDGMASVVRAGTPVSQSAPVERGDIITIRALGLGAVERAAREGQVQVGMTDTFFKPAVSLGGVGLEVLRSVMADFPGLYWISVRIPPEVPSGPRVPLRVRVNDIDAPTLTLPVRGPGPSFPRITVDRVEHPAWNGAVRDNGVYNAASRIIIRASNLRPNAPAFIRCTTPSGFSAQSPVVTIAAHSAVAIVPPYYDAASGTYLSGTVSCVLVQRVADQENASSPFSIRIQAPPLPRGNPGSLTLALLQLASQGPQQVQANLTLKDRANGGATYSAARTRAQMSAAVSAYVPYIDAIRRIANGSTASVNLGITETGQALTITRDDLSRLDRWIAMMMKEADASTANGESIVRALADGAPRFSPSSFSGTVGRLLMDCVNVFSWLNYTAGDRSRSPEESCDAARDAIGRLPAAAGSALAEAGAEVADFMEDMETASRWLPIPGVAQGRVIAVVGRLASIAATARIGTAVVGHVLIGVSPRSQEDRHMLHAQFRRTYLDVVVGSVLDDGLDESGTALFGRAGWEASNDVEDLSRLPVPARWRHPKVEGHEAEMLGPSPVRNADGSYSLVNELPPGPLTVVRGRASLDGQALREGYVEFGEGGTVTAPFATGAINPDGTFEMVVPRNQLGSTIPSSASVVFNVRVPGGSGYQAVNAGSVSVGSSTVTLRPVSLTTNPPTGPGGSPGGGNDSCGGQICARPAD